MRAPQTNVSADAVLCVYRDSTTRFLSPEPISQCTTGRAQCCQSVHKATDPVSKTLLGIVGVVVEGVNVLVG